MFLDRIRYTLDINPNENSWVEIGETLNKLEIWNSIDRNFTQKSHELDGTSTYYPTNINIIYETFEYFCIKRYITNDESFSNVLDSLIYISFVENCGSSIF